MFPVGHILNDTYRIERLLGRGGMALVYVVSHVRLPRRFALKVITAPSANSSEYVLRFRREAEILASLEHPNLVNVLDWNFTAEGKPYLVMELLSGEDLSECLRRTGALPIKVALSIFSQIAEALNAAHSHEIVHRDLKPANIFLCKNGAIPYFVKVLDFGIAKSAQHSSALVTDHMVLMGTPAYMAPEQARGNLAGVDARADQFALALVLYEMLSGQSAFYRRGEAAMMTLYRILSEEPEPLADPQMNLVLARALRKDPSDRYPTLSAFVEAVIGCVPELIDRPERTDRVTTSDDQEPAVEFEAPPESQPAIKHVPSLLTNRKGELLARQGDRRARLPGIVVGSGALLALLYVMVRAILPSKDSGEQVRPADLLERLDAGLPQDLSEPSAHEAFWADGSDLAPAKEMPGAKPDSSRPHPEPTDPDPDPVLDPDPASARHPVAKYHVPQRVELRLVGSGSTGPIGNVIRRCVSDTFGSSLRRMAGTVILLRRTDQLRVITRLSLEKSLQLEECLSVLRAMTSSIPKSVDVKIVEVR